MNKRSEIISLMRGSFATPVISWLGTSGVADRLLAGAVSLDALDDQLDEDRLRAVFEYLTSLGLVQLLDGSAVELTDLGRTVIKRHGSFSILASYGDYFRDLDRFLLGKQSPSVDRHQNVLGSGSIHSRKFFPAALRYLEAAPPTVIADVGCGDGRFLREAAAAASPEKLVGIDLSPDALAACQEQLNSIEAARELIESDAAEVNRWCSPLEGNDSLAISFWFVLHEISTGSWHVVADLLRAVNEKLPTARLILGDLTRFAAADIAEHRERSIMPEYQLFHALSGQNLLTWEDWQAILDAIPYRLHAETRFDTLEIASQATPSAFVWCLEPANG